MLNDDLVNHLASIYSTNETATENGDGTYTHTFTPPTSYFADAMQETVERLQRDFADLFSTATIIDSDAIVLDDVPALPQPKRLSEIANIANEEGLYD